MADGPARGAARRHTDRLVAALAAALFAMLRALGPDRASALGGRVARALGRFLPATRVADANLRRALPALDAATRARIIGEVWENLGRTAAEFPHLHRLAAERTELVGLDAVAALRAQGRNILFFTAHAANWELTPQVARLHGLPISVVYRALNNPEMDRLVLRQRDLGADGMIPKGPAGARRLLTLLRAGRPVGMLLDQKMNDGIAAPFFGIDAMTAPAAAQLALRFDLVLVPTQVERLAGARFRITLHPPLAVAPSDDRAADVLRITTAINAEIEGWVRARPGQWLWLHRRWPRPKVAAG